MTYATVEDVEVDYGPVPESEQARVAALLDRAEARVRLVVSDLDAKVANGTTDQVLVVQVESEMVAAVLRNPNCWQSQTETAGPFSQSHTVNLKAASGLLEFTDRHRELLGVRSRAGSVAPRLSLTDGPLPPDYSLPPVSGWWPWQQ